ncbi:hypothetical protein TVAG_206290 [Trichomonas vaginalis G3]|uniref:Importin N-terminal domain-containing protein n=1 Tax=Trichomonas vaginalis (strain ATCC PRA-98 / G3) TaxID=412133 RepID=A2E1L4_TRIV3|nr:armadillo (ARM) repeat-containing protein family [Trichomonas vaginalis G3]EAY13461.1 hypothetical protein TVAG_206290 [Trichomonas vaginalis G3]KAI5518344.1 armadillo (ARM) repeat-containing protein family [Trichomonas vaginalis G3]|eukprot:XP_001325684.1 hypothetical protein [Trichomonas vaginalis G3]
MSSPINEIAESISKFGGEILNKKVGEAPKIPQLNLQPADIIALFKLLKGDTSSEYDVGFYNIIDTYIAQSWANFTNEQKEEIKKLLINSAKTQINKHSLNRFANICVAVYDLTDKKWTELFNFVLESTPSDVTAKILIRFLASASEEFLTTNFAKIVHFITVSFSTVSNSLKENYFTVLSSLNSEEAFQIEPTLLDIFMTNLIQLIKEDPERQEFVVQTAIEVLVQAPKADSIVPKAITEAIQSIVDTESALPVLSIFPVLNSNSVVALLNRLISVTETYIKEKGALPLELLDSIEDSPIEDLSEDVLETLAKYFSGLLEKPGNTAAIAIFAPLCAQVADVYEDKKMNSIIDICFQGNGLSLCAALLIYQYIIEYEENLSYKIPQTAIIRIFNLMTSPDEKVRQSAVKSAREVINNGFKLTADSAAHLFKVYSVFPAAEKSKFFKLLRDILRSEVNAELISEQAFNFAFDNLKTETDAYIQSEYLSILLLDADYVQDLFTEEANSIICDKCIEMMKSDDEKTWKFASRCMIVMAQDEECQKKIVAVLPRFKQILSQNSNVSDKTRGNIAASYGSLVFSCDLKKEYDNLVDVATRFIQSENSHLISAGALLCEMGAANMSPSVIRKLFETEATVSMTIKEEEQLNDLLHSMIECFDKFRVESQQVTELFKSLSSGNHPVYKGKHFSSFVDKDTVIFKFLKTCISKFKELTPMLVTPMVQWFSSAPSQMFDSILDIITTLVDMKQVNGDDAYLLGETLFNRIGAVHDEGLDEIMLGTLTDLIMVKPDCIDSVRFCAKLVNLYEKLDEEEQPSLKGSVSATILSLCSTSDVHDIVGDELLKDILLAFPGEQGDGNADVMGTALVKMVDSSEKWADMKPFIATTLIRVLMLPNEELKKFEFRNPTINNMKRVTKQILASNPEIEKAVIKDFNKNRSMLNRFKKLFQ